MCVHVHYLSTIMFTTADLPLDYDVEGPSPNATDVVFILGARPISEGRFDLNYGGSIAAAVILASKAPPMFSGCVFDCLESLSANTSVATGTILELEFNRSARVIELIGPASPADFEAVLRTLVYLNRAPVINVQAIRLEVSDGIGTTSAEISITGSRRRRSVWESVEVAPVRHILSFHKLDQRDGVTTKGGLKPISPKDASGYSKVDAANFWPAGAIAVIAMCSVVMVVVVWGVKRQQHVTGMA